MNIFKIKHQSTSLNILLFRLYFMELFEQKFLFYQNLNLSFIIGKNHYLLQLYGIFVKTFNFYLI